MFALLPLWVSSRPHLRPHLINTEIIAKPEICTGVGKGRLTPSACPGCWLPLLESLVSHEMPIIRPQDSPTKPLLHGRGGEIANNLGCLLQNGGGIVCLRTQRQCTSSIAPSGAVMVKIGVLKARTRIALYTLMQHLTRLSLARPQLFNKSSILTSYLHRPSRHKAPGLRCCAALCILTCAVLRALFWILPAFDR